MINPVKAAREARGMGRTAFAMKIGIGYIQAASIELGQQRSIPKPWRAGLEAAGFDFDQLNEEYQAWRAAKAQGGDAA